MNSRTTNIILRIFIIAGFAWTAYAVIKLFDRGKFTGVNKYEKSLRADSVYIKTSFGEYITTDIPSQIYNAYIVKLKTGEILIFSEPYEIKYFEKTIK